MTSAAREAIVLPLLFLTVTLLGGFRAADTVRLVPPSLTAVVLAVLLQSTLVRGGVIAPQVLLHGGRSGLEYVSGAIVLVTFFFATAQAINVVLPERGLLHGAFAIFLFVQLMMIGASGAGRRGVLRSLFVLFGSLFILRFIVVEALYAPGGGVLSRIFTTLMAGATLGGIVYEPNAPVTGYVAFVSLALYLVGVLLLPLRVPGTAMIRLGPETTDLAARN